MNNYTEKQQRIAQYKHALSDMRRRNRIKAEEHLWDAVRLLRHSDPQYAHILTSIAERVYEKISEETILKH